MSDYQVYIITGPTNKQYIGMTGKGYLYRWRQHVYTSKYRQSPLYAAILKYGELAFKIEILKEGLSIEEAFESEIFYIDKLNTLYPNGYNLTKGGDGVMPSPIISECLSEKAKKRFENPEEKEKQRQIALKQWQSKEFKNNIKKGMIEKWKDEETRKKRIESYSAAKIGIPWSEERKLSLKARGDKI